MQVRKVLGCIWFHELLGDVGGGHGDDVIECDDNGGLVVDAGYSADDTLEDSFGDSDGLVLDKADFLFIYSMDLRGLKLSKADEVDHCRMTDG